MIKRLLIFSALIVTGLIAVEMAGLLQLKANLTNYARYWHERPTTGEFVYVALGDSAAQGIGASRPERGYVGLLTRHIEQQTGKSVRVVNLSVSGAKITDVISKQLPLLKNYQPDLVTVEIGSNDVVRYDAATFQQQYDHLAAALPPGSVVSNLPFFGGRIRRDKEVTSANRVIFAAVAKDKLQLVDLYGETKQHQSLRNNSFDLFHPSNRGYKNWEAAFWKVIRPSLLARQPMTVVKPGQ